MPGGRKGRPKKRAPEGGKPGGDEFQQALSYAFKLLSYRQRSEQELLRRLGMKGFGPEAAEAVMDKLRASGYIDDRATAGSLRLRAEEGKLLGLSGAKQYLMLMGISRVDTEEALEGYDEAASATRLAEKKMNALASFPPDTARQKLSGYLKRRGFSYETIRKTVEAFIDREEK